MEEKEVNWEQDYKDLLGVCINSKNRIEELEEENKKIKEELHNTQLLLNAGMEDYMELEEENRKLEIDKIHWRDLYWEECEKNKKLKDDLLHYIRREEEYREEIRFLEQCLDNKEKVNKSLREDLKIWRLTAKDYAKQCGVDLDDD